MHCGDNYDPVLLQPQWTHTLHICTHTKQPDIFTHVYIHLPACRRHLKSCWASHLLGWQLPFTFPGTAKWCSWNDGKPLHLHFSIFGVAALPGRVSRVLSTKSTRIQQYGFPRGSKQPGRGGCSFWSREWTGLQSFWAALRGKQWVPFHLSPYMKPFWTFLCRSWDLAKASPGGL